jgi:HK97 family phage major capsid protein
MHTAHTGRFFVARMEGKQVEIRELLTKRAGLVTEMEALAAKGTAITAEEEKRFDAIQAEIDGIDKAVARLEKAQGAASAQHPADSHVQVLGNREADRPFASLGEQIRAVIASAQIGATIDPRLLRVQAATGLSGGVPSDGGFLIQKDFAQDLLTKATKTGILHTRCRRIPIGATSDGLKANGIDENSRADGSRWGGVQVYRANEAGTVSATKPKWQAVEINLEDLMGLCYLTNNLMNDTVALGAWIEQAFLSEYGYRMDKEVVRGTGAGQMLGWLNSPALVTVAKETGQAAQTILSKNLSKMWARLWVSSRPNAAWFINQDIEPQLDELYIAAGTGALEPRFITYGPDGVMKIKGAPVIAIEQASTLGTVGDINLVDLSQYIIIEKGNGEYAESIHVQFLYNERVLRFVWRNNGRPLWNSALTPANGSNTVSPMIALATRA